jgi:TatD DNase family protein
MIEEPRGLEAILANAREMDVGHMLCVSVEEADYPVLRQLAADHDSLSASIGIHPNTEMGAEPQVGDLVRQADHPGVVAIGETGLDYYRSRGDLGWQRDRFRTHIRAAREISKPLIIHCREAKEDVLTLLKEEHASDIGGVMHCFVEDLGTAQRAMDLNFLISFSGIVTFKNAAALKDVARALPLDAMLVETDSPYLAPVPYRGKPNQPAYVRYVAEHIAALRDIGLEEVAAATTANFNRLFRPANPVS